MELMDIENLDGFFSPLQFENKFNIQCHRVTAPEIYSQIQNNLGKWEAFIHGFNWRNNDGYKNT